MRSLRAHGFRSFSMPPHDHRRWEWIATVQMDRQYILKAPSRGCLSGTTEARIATQRSVLRSHRALWIHRFHRCLPSVRLPPARILCWLALMIRAIDENTITDAVIEQMSQTPNERLKEIMEIAVRHLHAFAREANLTPDEWIGGIRFLTAAGHACTEYRQEFILLSDTLGLSSLINSLHDKRSIEDSTK